jgi:hypothetical protein
MAIGPRRSSYAPKDPRALVQHVYFPSIVRLFTYRSVVRVTHRFLVPKTGTATSDSCEIPAVEYASVLLNFPGLLVQDCKVHTRGILLALVTEQGRRISRHHRSTSLRYPPPSVYRSTDTRSRLLLELPPTSWPDT